MPKRIYFDYNATTPVDVRVMDDMIPFFNSKFGNASSNTHFYGWEADLAVKKARNEIAACLGVSSNNIIFTSGATESNNMVFFSVAHAASAESVFKIKGKHIITSSIEHKSVLNCCKFLEALGWRVTYLPVNQQGFVTPKDVQEAITEETILISIMAVNNELGTIQPVGEIGEIAASHGVLFHIDAAQAVGKIPFKVEDTLAHFVSFSAHKIYGPKGVGGLYTNQLKMIKAYPLLQGGGQERGMRSGTLNVPGIIGLAKAFELAYLELEKENRRLLNLKDILFSTLQQNIPGIKLNGTFQNSIPGTLNVYIPNVDGLKLLSSLKNKFAVSNGSACTSASQEYSYVLKAIGCREEEAKSSFRISFGRFTTLEDIESLAAAFVNFVEDQTLLTNRS